VLYAILEKHPEFYWDKPAAQKKYRGKFLDLYTWFVRRIVAAWYDLYS
jgi:hypothetical protein